RRRSRHEALRGHDLHAAELPRQAAADQPRPQLRQRLPEREGRLVRPHRVGGRAVVLAQRAGHAASASSEARRLSARAAIVVTGTEVLTGRVRDRNGPWLADRLVELGIELAHITICGDRPEDMDAQLRFQADQGCDVIVTSGGLGPTADDLTMEVVARFCGRELKHDPEPEERIQASGRPLLARYPSI